MKEEKKKVIGDTPAIFEVHLLFVMKKDIERNQLIWKKKMTIRYRRTRRSKCVMVQHVARANNFLLKKNIILKGNYVTNPNQIYN